MLSLLGTDMARLDQPGHYRLRASRLRGLFLYFWCGLSSLDEAIGERGISGQCRRRRWPVLLTLGLHREERNPSFSVYYVCIFTCSRVSSHDKSERKDYDKCHWPNRAQLCSIVSV